MAIAKCRECKKEVSTSAETCPHCGAKKPVSELKEQILGFIMLIGIVLAIWNWATGDDETKPSPTPTEVASSPAEPPKAVSPPIEPTPEPKPEAKPEVKPEPEQKKEPEITPEEQAKLDEACKKDETCITDKYAMVAETICPQHIESLARYEHKWTDGWLGMKFIRGGWADGKHTFVRYWGDQLKLQNGFNAWAKVTYTCDLSLEGEVLRVKIYD